MAAKKNSHILKNVSGFPEFSPEAQILFNQVVNTIREAYEACGAVPIETSAIERTEHILAKGGNDKEIYGLHRLQDSEGGSKDYALHFDLTLPLARYVAQNGHRLVFPFKRYQIQPVWRGERAQNKRYRQFYQCDIDVIGDGKLSLLYDAEIPSIIYQIFSALQIGDFIIRINNRKVLKGILNHFGIKGDDNELAAINIIDDLEKVGLDDVSQRLAAMGADSAALAGIVEFFDLDGSTQDVLNKLQSLDYGELFKEGVAELTTVCSAIADFGVPEQVFKIDLKIARGLDYYTGTVYETQLVANPSIGSICSGGRYENLAENFSKRAYPGVGISIGLSRLFGELIEKQILNVGPQSIAPVLVTVLDQSCMPRYLEITAQLREAGIKTEIYLEPKKLKNQLAHADKKGIKVALIAGETEFDKDEVQVKDLINQTQESVAADQLVPYIKALLAA
ncbi:MAG: histidine--tRNA ligase [Thiolinea sp.]